MNLITKIFGDPNEKELKSLRPIVDQINALEDEVKALTDEELRGRTADFKEELANGATLDDILPDVFAVVREAGRRAIGMRHFDVQLIGGMVLHQGKIAEMRTGEGKTLVATLPAYLNALTGKGVHIVTVNDYLAQRDRDWMGKIFEFLGLSVGVILTTMPPQGPERRAAYAADITYGTNNELGFDYLRDNMVPDAAFCVQRELNYAIVDEVDNILIDEARTPLIISGQAEESAEIYQRFARVVPRLKPDEDYSVDLKERTVAITDTGIDKVEQAMGLHNLYEDMELTRHLENALKASVLFKLDKDYIVRDGEVLIVDEFTGRVLVGRRYSEGLHQAIEAKEGVKIQNENRTLATITYQNYFRLYGKLAGMTGTALTEAEEFNKIYKLDVVVIPTNKPITRTDNPDFIYRSEEGKFQAVVQEIQDRHDAGQPVLVGTTSVEISEYLSDLLNRHGVPHNVLNAKQHAREAQIITQAGRSGAVTIATNMAGRGTDIVLGGNPATFVDSILADRGIELEFATDEDRAEALEEAQRRCEEDRKKVLDAGGLYIIGTERHESRRIDNQLRGRSGRQGDPGESRFFVSLQDELMRRFGSDRVAGIMGTIGLGDDIPLESRAVSSMLEQAQSKVEAANFDVRKHVVEYDDVISKQREVIYADRRKVLDHADMYDRIVEMIEHDVTRLVAEHTRPNMPEEWDLDGIVKQFELWGIEVPDDIFPEQLNRLKRDQLTESLKELALEGYGKREEEVTRVAKESNATHDGSFFMRQFERQVILQVVDTLWREHIDHLDEMRSGIGLRGLAQRDPLNEFKAEAYRAFERLKGELEHYIVDMAMRGGPIHIEVAAPPPQALPRNLQTNAQEMAAELGQTKSAGQPLPAKNGNGARPAGAIAGATGTRPAGSNGAKGNAYANAKKGSGKGATGAPAGNRRPQPAHANMSTSSSSAANGKIGRNDPCYCGSGKKYKMCHGR
ncbi:MAG TPA: preprotein translocase subunit SecA [Ktedonobacterales bacterium]|nr:preprotein translocase subunit SecA [Ktedonobacterales bacterium]